jgi:sigma-B regulation protein RsbU (phosphoserine phosphatase)
MSAGEEAETDASAHLARTHLERSLELAAEVQARLLPRSAPTVRGFELFGWSRGAEGASGDFHDFVRAKAGGAWFVVGDVAGHGVGPALVTAAAQAGLRAYTRLLQELGEVVTLLNADLSPRIDPGMFLTLFLAQIDERGHLRTLNAGQTPPLLWRAGTGAIEALPADGPALGMIPEFVYTAGTTLTMQPGDLLIAITDGIVEARSPESPERLFGASGVRDVLAAAGRAGLDATATAKAVASAVLELTGGAHEDGMTIVAVRRTGALVAQI